MKNGFEGKAANNYIKITGNTINSFHGKSIANDSCTKNSDCISINDEYFSLFQSVSKNTNISTLNAIEYVLNEIENMCNTIFVVPAANPKIFKVTQNIKNQLAEYNSLNDSLLKESQTYLDEVQYIDNNFSKKKFTDAHVSLLEKDN